MPPHTQDESTDRISSHVGDTSHVVIIIITLIIPHVSPCLLVAEFLGDDLSELQSEALRYLLREVRMRAAAEYFNIRHFFSV